MNKKAVDNKTLIALKQAGKSYREIEAITGIHKDVVNRRIRYLLPDEDTKTYINNRADIFAKMQQNILQSIDDADIKKAPFGSRILAACQIYDKERTERGLTNSISAVIHSDIEALRATSKGPDYEVIDIDGE